MDLIINMQNKKQLHGLNLFKGSLIILVIIGHMIRGHLNETLIRYVIYGFHMPLFIAISGFLIDFNKLKIVNWITLIKKYLHRIIIPWLFAVTIYFILTSSKDNQLKFFTDSFIHPYFHLWYIPGILSYIFIAALAAKFNISIQVLLIASLLISVIGHFAYLRPDSCQVFKNYLLLTVHETLRPQFFTFFCLGMYLRLNQKILKINIKVIIIFTICSASLYVCCFYYPNLILSIVVFFILNILLIILMIRFATDDIMPKVKFLEWIGINSLPIYLWHVLPLVIISSINYLNSSSFLYYFSRVIAEICIIIIIRLLINVKQFNQFVFGSVHGK